MGYCDWDRASSEATRRYHDEEWGVPLGDDDKRQFEYLGLEVMQCGLSWDLMIKKREIFASVFEGWDFERLALWGEADERRALAVPGMIRSPRKIRAIVQNARSFLQIRAEFGSFGAYLRGFAGEGVILYERHAQGYVPASNALSESIARDLKKRGFKYLGGITIYSHLQACGVINDHDENCPRYAYICANFPTRRAKRKGEKDVRFYGDKRAK